MDVGVVDDIQTDVVCRPPLIPGHRLQLQDSGTKSGGWPDIEGEGLSLVLLGECEALGWHPGPTGRDLQGQRSVGGVASTMSERDSKAMRQGGVERPELGSGVELHVNPGNNGYRSADLTSGLVDDAEPGFGPKVRLRAIASLAGQLSRTPKLRCFERISVERRSENMVFRLGGPDIQISFSRSPQEVRCGVGLFLQNREVNGIGLNFSGVDAVVDRRSRGMTLCQGNALGGRHLHAVRLGRGVPGRQHPTEGLSSNNTIIVDQSVEDYVTQIGAHRIQVCLLVAELDTPGIVPPPL